MSNIKSDSIVITGTGMITSVGHNACQACASIRADIVRIETIDVFEIKPVYGCPISGITDAFIDRGRFRVMVSHAMDDLITNARLSQKDFSHTDIYLALPPLNRYYMDSNIAEKLPKEICSNNPFLLDKEHQIKLYPDGHAAAATALQDAMLALEEDRINYAIIGGVDSLVFIDTLLFFFKKGRIKYENNPYGFTPGEAAAFILLEKCCHAQKRNAAIMSAIEAPHTETEPITIWSDKPGAGSGLSQVISKTFADLSDHGENTGTIICDLNGEPYRAKEFGYAISRSLNGIKTNWQLVHPASNLGDTGAASFVISLCTGARSLERGYSKTDNILSYGASDDGLRGAAYLRKYK